MVHQRTRLPHQPAGRGGYGGMNQTTKCLNCGFGRGQFGVEFCDDYCSLDCYTSAKVTGRILARNTNSDDKNNGQATATPWPRGLLVEAPPAPKPWRGRTWSNDTIRWRTNFTYNSNVSADDSSSIESAADWPIGGAGAGGGRGAADDRVVGGRGADSGLRFGVAGGLGNANTIANANANTVEKRSPAVISGGGAASSNGGSGGRSVGDACCNRNSSNSNRNSGAASILSSCWGMGGQDEGSRMQRRDGGVNRGGEGGGGVEGGGGDNCRVGAGMGGGETAALSRRELPPLAPIPRAGAFRQQPRQVQSGGRNVDERVVAFAPTPTQATPDPHSKNAAAAAGKIHSTLRPAGAQIHTGLGGIAAVGVGVPPRGGKAALRVGEPNLEGVALKVVLGDRSTGAAGAGTGNSATTVGQDGGAADAAGQKATGAAEKAVTRVDGEAAVEATAVVIGEETEGSGERVPSMDGLVIGTRCGAAAGAGAGAGAGAEGEDAKVMERIMSCAPVRTYPTRAVIRQWRHMFLP